jgi:hypothetical protein
MLIAWVLGLAMGVAHACALDGAADPGHATLDQAALEGLAHEEANCLEFCEKSAVASVAPKSFVDVPAPGATPALPPSSTGAEAMAQSRFAPDAQRRDHGPPLRIAYRRLVL